MPAHNQRKGSYGDAAYESYNDAKHVFTSVITIKHRQTNTTTQHCTGVSLLPESEQKRQCREKRQLAVRNAHKPAHDSRSPQIGHLEAHLVKLINPGKGKYHSGHIGGAHQRTVFKAAKLRTIKQYIPQSHGAYHGWNPFGKQCHQWHNKVGQPEMISNEYIHHILTIGVPVNGSAMNKSIPDCMDAVQVIGYHRKQGHTDSCKYRHRPSRDIREQYRPVHKSSRYSGASGPRLKMRSRMERLGWKPRRSARIWR